MHKLAKGLKKKKKGKKSKHKEEELFKPEELEEYRRQHAATSEETAKNEEWKNFLSLTSGVDDILKKTQDDLDRIKSTSFFQRVPPPSETAKKRQQEQEALRESKAQEAAAVKEQSEQLGIVQLSESESEEEEDDIFDTTYIDAIAAGEVKLAYIPESPTDKTDGDDPFDTSYAERAILGPAVERKGKKLVPLGAAVEVLTGRVTLPTCATVRPVSKRQIHKERDLLLDSFDSSDSLTANSDLTVAPPPKTLLDDDEIPLPDEPIDLSKSLYIPPPQPVETVLTTTQQNILKEFEEDEDDKEFEALAAESLSKPLTNVVTSELLEKAVTIVTVKGSADWKPFENHVITDVTNNFDDIDDPFDTTFAENILPGKAELKLLEKEILEDEFNPRAVKTGTVVKKSIVLSTRVPDSELTLIKPVHRDLLGGSTTDLSNLGEKPILPTEEVKSEEIRYSDPFDTSIVDSVKAPGQAELKFLEKELLGDIQTTEANILKALSIDDDDFNPRALETQSTKPRTLSRPDVLNVTGSKSVSFSVPTVQKDLLGAEDTTKVLKPLTPFYVRKASVPGLQSPDSQGNDQDPFDTSFVPSLAPGKTELKIIESELCNSNTAIALDDPLFDPRDETQVAKVVAVEAIKKIANPKPKSSIVSPPPKTVDLLSAVNDIGAKVLTPAATNTQSFSQDEEISYVDPFDTSVVATNILPGKAELRLLESELIESNQPSKLEDQKDLLVHSGDTIIEKPLSPEVGQSFDIEPDDFDPFDTSFATNIQPGRAELKVLESELI